MSERNVELSRRVLDAFNARDIEALVAYFDPSIELHSAFGAVAGGVYQGHEGVREYFRDLQDAWDEIRLEPEAYVDLGDHTLVFVVVRRRGRHSGTEVVMPTAQMFGWREGASVYFKGHRGRCNGPNGRHRRQWQRRTPRPASQRQRAAHNPTRNEVLLRNGS